MDFKPGEKLLYSWNSHMVKWNKQTKKHDTKGNMFTREVTFLKAAGERAIILCQTPCGPVERIVAWASLQKKKDI